MTMNDMGPIWYTTSSFVSCGKTNFIHFVSKQIIRINLKKCILEFLVRRNIGYILESRMRVYTVGWNY